MTNQTKMASMARNIELRALKLIDQIKKNKQIQYYEELCIEFETMVGRYKANLELSLEWGILPKDNGLVLFTKQELKFCDFNQDSDEHLILKKTETMLNLIGYISKLIQENTIIMCLHYYKKHNLLHALPQHIRSAVGTLPEWINQIECDFEDDGCDIENAETKTQKVKFAI